MGLNLNAVGTTSEPFERSWDHKDALLYALGVGAGALDPTGFELEFTTENSDGVTPARPARPSPPSSGRAAGRHVAGGLRPGHARPRGAVHPLARRAARRRDGLDARPRWPACTTRAPPAWSCSRASRATSSSGEPAFSTRTALFIRGAGGFGGPRNPEGDDESALAAEPLPTREPDEVVSYSTRPDQALLYRLSGDRNPLHSDPTFAKRAGFDRPILHGLCTYGFTGRALLHAVCGSDPARFGAMRARFSKPTMPGDTLTRLAVGHRRSGARRLPVPHRDAARRDGHRRRAVLDCRLNEPADRRQPRQSAHTPKISTVCVTSL